MTEHECVSFILIQNESVLLEKRSESKYTDPGMTAIPGGHIECGETREQALARELTEELGITALSHRYLCSLYHPCSEMQLIHYYVVTHWQGELAAFEADEISWIALDSAPIDIESDKVALKEYRRLEHSLVLRPSSLHT